MPQGFPTMKESAIGASASLAGAHPVLVARCGAGMLPRLLTARRDSMDFRDRMFAPTLVEVPAARSLATYRRLRLPVLDQGEDGACTGYALAAVVNFLGRRVGAGRTRTADARAPRYASPRMLYDMARRYDEWPGEDYDGASARGAMKGWHKHGACADGLWAGDSSAQGRPASRRRRDDDAWDDALRRPLGAYYRVNHGDLVAMHSAIAEVGILYATAGVHEGWRSVGADGQIVQAGSVVGGHAFAIVGYDAEGFWLQNSWGTGWGRAGYARIGYADWLENGTDAWVARMGVPVVIGAAGRGVAGAVRSGAAQTHHRLRPHIVSVGNDGLPRPSGAYGTRAEDIEAIFRPGGAFAQATQGWSGTKHLVLYAHGGLVDEQSAVQRIAEFCDLMLPQQAFPVAFVWKTDLATTLHNILRDAFSRRRSEGMLDSAKDFLLDRVDDALEPLARVLAGKALWDEMKENARRAALTAEERKRFSDPATVAVDGASCIVATAVAALCARDPDVAVHVVAHSAGAIFMGPLIAQLRSAFADAGVARGPVATCTLWAPACTVRTFKEEYGPYVETGAIDELALYTLTDEVEQADSCGRIYNKSLLYLVSNALEARPRIPLFRDGEPILGMARFVPATSTFAGPAAGRVTWIQAPNHAPIGDPLASRAMTHGAFDDDRATVAGTVHRITRWGGAPAFARDGAHPAAPSHEFAQTARACRERRQQLTRETS